MNYPSCITNILPKTLKDIVLQFCWFNYPPHFIQVLYFSSIKGYNEKDFGEKWGGEDTEVIDRIVGRGLFLIHQRMQRFYHIYHNRNGTWLF